MARFLTILTLAAVVGLFSVSMAKADPVGGTINQYEVAKPRSIDTFHVRLYGGETTRIRVNGDGDTELNLYVYDGNGNLVKCDLSGSGDDREVLVTPRWTGLFTIKIVNRGYSSNCYRLLID